MSFHGVSWRDRDRESNDLVNHIGGVFRYFIVDVVDPGSTPDVARCGRELAAQVYGGRIHESVESVEMISNYEIMVSLEFSRVQESATVFSEGFHGVLGLNLQGISVAGGRLIYVGISARWYSLVSVKGVAEGLKETDSCRFVYVYVFGVTHSFLLEWIFENEELLVQGRVRLNRWRYQIKIDSGWKHRFFALKVFLASCAKRRDLLATTAVQSNVQGKGFWFEAVVIQVLQELQVSIDISWKLWRRRISRFVVTITTTTTSETEEETFTEDDLKARDGFRLKELESNVINLTGTEGFSEITRNAACSSFSEVLRVTQKVSGCKKKARIVTKSVWLE
ncbi:hypothetical protein F2Q69_00053851 [Brassica cretica]|uniref:Uncharacterized protein n=1 Tax=Brassica cretica TaxID=69181 RepID=A0A8S9N7B4_BRACR|nr:hypothetical protein F2Q69_00053851 [Brassica cretica]